MIEYKILELPKKVEQIEENINLLSIDGWRLVCACGKLNRHLIFKRKVRREYE